MIRTQIMALLSGGLLFLVAACNRENKIDCPDEGDLSGIPYKPEPYNLIKPAHFPEVPIPPDNPLTVAGIQLGRRLFYDPILSGDSTMSCSSCHLPQGSFTDNLPVSVGIAGVAGTRSSMSLLNIAYATNGLFWDGRVRTLEEQALLPVEDPIELHTSWHSVVEKLQKHPEYPRRFREAFGINSTCEITKELAAKAIAQFERILISSGNSRYDRFRFKGDLDAMDDEEIDGMIMYFEEAPTLGLNLPDAQCFHCHGGITLTGNNFFSNGIDAVTDYMQFKDPGLGGATNKMTDRGKFRATTLRNIALTAPYMHDGRFQTLEEVVEHYSSHGKSQFPYQDPLIREVGSPIPGTNPVQYTGLTPYQKNALVKFLHTLTDTDFVNNPDIQNPFE